MPTALSISAVRDALQSAGYTETSFHHKPPPVVVLDVPYGSTERGRFFPSINAIAVADGPDSDVATNHELAHAAVYAKRCGGTCQTERTRCSYRGAHSAAFYRELARIHKHKGMSVARAREFERTCGYAYPKAWDRKVEW